MLCPPIAGARRSAGRWLVLAIVATFVPSAGFGADPPDATTSSSTKDAVDVWRQIRHEEPTSDEDSDSDGSQKHFLFFSPSVSSRPATGLSGGVAATLVFIDGDPKETHFSTAGAGVRVSVKGQVLTSLRFSMFSSGDRWFVQGENRLQWTSLNTYDLGLDRSPVGENLRYDWFRFYDTAYRRIRRSRLFVGMGLNVNDHTNIRPGTNADAGFADSAYLQYSQTHQFTATGQTSSGTNVGLFVDTRDNGINAYRGWLASTTFRTFFDGFLGGDATWQELNLDVRTYRSLTHDARHRLAFWMLGDFVTGGTAPFFDLPATAGDMSARSARGYGEGQYRGSRLLYGEVEYRGALTRNGLLGIVTFLNVTTLAGDTPGDNLFRSFAPGAGGGLRVLLDKHSRTNLCADYGFGVQGSRGFYLAIQEAF